MTHQTNQFGLPRYIPSEVKRRVREWSKFGCVICRCAIYEYEHIDPVWAEAKEHDPSAMCLLCGTCHAKVTRGHLSKDTVLAQYHDMRCRQDVQRPFSDFDLRSRNLVVVLGGCRFTNPQVIFQIDGSDLLAISQPFDGVGFPSLSGIFCNDNGEEIFQIVENEWKGPLNCWDLEITGPVITVRAAKRSIVLQLIVEPPDTVRVVALDMRLGSCRVRIDGQWLILERSNGPQVFHLGVIAACHHAAACVVIDSRGPHAPSYRALRMIGGEGIYIDDTGVRVGSGNAKSLIQGVEFGQREELGSAWIKTRIDFLSQTTETVRMSRKKP